MTATSSQGLALMWEMLYIASGDRLPIIMPVVNRALSAPLNIHGDHSDAMGARDSGWIQLWSENAQESYDNTIQAFRIGEHMDIRLPVMICLDGFIISHSIERIEYLEDTEVKDFVGEFKFFKPGPDGVDREMYDNILAVLDDPGNEHTNDEKIEALYGILGVKRPDWHGGHGGG